MFIIGLMSGTSMDGIDAVLLETNGEQHIIRHHATSLSYPTEFKLALKQAEAFVTQQIDECILNQQLSHKADFTLPIQEVIDKSTHYHQLVINDLLSKAHLTSADIDYIGYHGQTLCHRPQQQFSLQVGDAQYLANQFNTAVVSDFRDNDLQHGGQGAPLAPLYHQALMQQQKLPSVVMINIGGIANVSVIHGTAYEDIQSGFDTGPGNVLLDQFVRQFTDNQQLFDKDGGYGLQGTIDEDFLKVLFEKTALINNTNYYALKPAKSLDSRDIQFIPEILQRFSKNSLTHLYDGCATLAAFTAYTIVHGITLLSGKIPQQWIVAGGGTKNTMLMKMLVQYISQYFNNDITLLSADQIGFSSTYMEAELMAWLTARSIRNLPLTIPQTTGVKFPVSGGKLFLPN